ncbi:RyR domain-containing protein [Spirosoma foliorum]|uniref:RyR domain-containing protein n=1 Tax=Spirosoma foliorum TaxID=2710596 RepID=UPI001C7171B8|nr:RyR domain-containing protein [Spirosoma foliorum]
MEGLPGYDSLAKLVIAKACHEANRVWCQLDGDYSQKHWDEAEQWQRDSAIKGVEFRLANPQAPQSAQHDAWSADKVADGWVYGETKDAVAKTHPCLVPFEELPLFQQKKDKLFQSIVDALK